MSRLRFVRSTALPLTLALSLSAPAFSAPVDSIRAVPSSDEGPSARPDRDEGLPLGRDHAGPPPLHEVLERNADRLGIEQEVTAEAEAIGGRAERRLRGLLRVVRGERRALEALLDDKDATVDEVTAQAQRLEDAESDMHRERLAILLDVRALLSAEQWEAVQDLRPERRGAPGAEPGPPPRDPASDR